MNHTGGPLGLGPYAERRNEAFRHWQNALNDLAGCENVTIKLGGISMNINGFGWQDRATLPGSGELTETTRPFIEHAIDAFGPE